MFMNQIYNLNLIIIKKGSAGLQHATLVHPALHPQMPVRSYL